MTKLTVIGLGRVKAGAETELVETLKVTQEKSRKEPDTELYTVHLDVDDPRSFAIYEIYKDDEAFAAHEKGEAFQSVLPFLKEHLDSGELVVKKLRAL